MLAPSDPLRWERRAGGVLTALTHRHGGVSDGEYAGLNLGSHVDDVEKSVQRNRQVLSERLGVPVAYMRQVHGAAVEQVGDASGEPTCDAMVTTTPGLALAVLVADCTPVMLADPAAGVVGVAHAGRPGMLAGVVPAVVEAMADLGASDISAVIGPSVCSRCYEVPAKMRSEAAAENPAAYAMTWGGTPAIDVAGAVMAQLATLPAVTSCTWLPGCTREDDSLYSYRRDGRTGRLAGVVGLSS
ncbi:peptidoglycan editing factor PgeF [Marihabitans asiaticum]|uniref:Purine nucleoside phosphorylase n=1 Tax=Marihabitans asiaticum TaxID=415218 RepID=A0A560WAA6_9MICO|nr:polyphenol oxidase family protein [Marihabitans asiaticum]TWD14480.1 hypothetical protein FB557_1890 [Marihabitans asiaticum]